MDDLERAIGEIAARRANAERAPEPVRSLLIGFIDQQERTVLDKQAGDAEI